MTTLVLCMAIVAAHPAKRMTDAQQAQHAIDEYPQLYKTMEPDEKKAEIERINQMIKQAKSELSHVGTESYDSAADKRKALEIARIKISILQNRLAIAKLGKKAIGDTIDPGDMHVGEVGVLLYAVDIVQVIDQNTLLCRSSHSEPFLLRGFSTAGMSDGRVLNMKELVAVTKTDSYTAVSGAKRTVLVVEPAK